MLTIFAYDAVAHNPSFAAGLIDPPAIHGALVPGKKAQYGVLDAAYWLGHTAAMESNFEDVLPPAHFTPAEVDAFRLGAVEGWKSLEFDDPSDPRDWDTELGQMAEEREWVIAYENGFNHS